MSRIVYNNKINYKTFNSWRFLPNIVFLNGYIDISGNHTMSEYNSDVLSVYNNIIYNSCNCTFRNWIWNNIIYNSENIISHKLIETNIRNSNDILIHYADNTTINRVEHSIINYAKYCSLQDSNIVCYGIESTEIKNSNVIFYFTNFNELFSNTKELYNSIMNKYSGDMLVHVENTYNKSCIENKYINKDTIMDI